MLRLVMVLVLLLPQQNLLAQHGETTVETQPISEPRHEPGTKAEEPVAEDEQREANSQSTVLQRLERVERFVETTQSDQQGQRDPDHEVRDLQAQEAMAFWAAAMFWSAIITVALTIAALLALIRTLHHTRRAADYARDMTEEARQTTAAAVKSLSLTEKFAHAQLRAYVTLKEANVPEDTPQDYLSVRMLLENCGQTPAFVKRIRQVVKATTGPIMKHDIEMDEQDLPYQTTIGSGQSNVMFGGQRRLILRGFHDQIRTGEMSIVAHLKVEYTDVFGAEHTSIFTRVMEGGMHIPGGLVAKPDYPDEVT